MKNKLIAVLFSCLMISPVSAMNMQKCNDEYNTYQAKVMAELYSIPDPYRNIKKPAMLFMKAFYNDNKYQEACKNNNLYGEFYKFIKQKEQVYKIHQPNWNFVQAEKILIKNVPDKHKKYIIKEFSVCKWLLVC